MDIKQYDRVLLKNGNEAVIVEIFAPNRAFLADIEKDGDIYTEDVTIDEIREVLPPHGANEVNDDEADADADAI